MSSSDLLALAILPAVTWASIAFVAVSTTGFASKLRAARKATTKQELIESAQSWALYAILNFLTVLCGVLAWARVQKPDPLSGLVTISHWGRDVFLGIILGLALVGFLQVLGALLRRTTKFGLPVLAGIASPPLIRVGVVLLVVFTEELWRALCLNTAMANGLPVPQALIAASIAYGLTYIVWGTGFAISEFIVGAVLGTLFLSSRTILLPVAAHLVLQVQTLLFALAATPDSDASAVKRKPFTKCPGCATRLSLQQVKLNVSEAFFCPHCHARLTSSDGRRGILRWGGAVLIGAILLATSEVFPELLFRTNYWISAPIYLFSVLGVSSILYVLFPFKLEFGDPDFISLNLHDGRDGQSEEDPKN